jgi:hypothetical protein
MKFIRFVAPSFFRMFSFLSVKGDSEAAVANPDEALHHE